MISRSTLVRVENEWAAIAGDAVQVEEINGTIYGYTTELGALRLFRKYNLVSRCVGTTANYSANLRKWYFALQMKYEVPA